MVFQQVGVEVAQVGRDAQVAGGDDRAGGGVLERIDVELEIVFEEASEGFEDAALQVGVIFSSKISRRLGTPIAMPIFFLVCRNR